jgi:hypothetical protein
VGRKKAIIQKWGWGKKGFSPTLRAAGGNRYNMVGGVDKDNGDSTVKKSTLILLVAVVMLGCIGLTGCRSGPTPPVAGELTWDDMPVYEGTSQVDKGDWAIPQELGDRAEVEWRYYRFDEPYTSIAEVTMFYRNEMPKNNWVETVWMEGASWGIFSKNGGLDDAMVWIGSEEGHTIIALMRASD